LTAKGIEQARKLKEHLAHRPSGGRSFTAFDLVVVSPLTRTLETANHIFGAAPLPCPSPRTSLAFVRDPIRSRALFFSARCCQDLYLRRLTARVPPPRLTLLLLRLVLLLLLHTDCFYNCALWLLTMLSLLFLMWAAAAAPAGGGG
jgi:hypothetical protein